MSLADVEKIFKAVECNDEKTVKYLVEEKAVPPSCSTYDAQGRTPAHIAAMNGNLRLVEYLVGKDPSILFITDSRGYTILYTAIERGHLNLVMFLVEKHHLLIFERFSKLSGNCAIHGAAEFGHLNILKYFIEERRGDITLQNDNKWTPLFVAAFKGHLNIVKYLVEEKNADLTDIDNDGRNILYISVFRDDLQLTKYILDVRKVNLDVNWQDELGDTIVHRAATSNSIQTLKYLVHEKNANINIPDKWGETPLHCAARWNYHEICSFLLQHGADTEIVDQGGLRPIEEASDKDLIKYMQDAITKRARRSVLGPSELIFNSTQCSLPFSEQKFIGNRASNDGINVDHSLFQNFLIIIRSFVKFKPIRKPIFQDSIDTFALKAIYADPANFHNN